jgi:hypothetical protein
VKPTQEPVVIAIVADTRSSPSTNAPGLVSSIPLRKRPAVPSHRITWYVRTTLLLIAAILIGVFAVAAWLNPYNPDGTPRRLATHRQLGLPPCNFVLLTGKPCPSCGMTTSFALFIRGDLRASLQANWVGTLLAAGAAMALPWSLLSAWRGRLLGIPSGYGDYLLTLAVTLLLILMLGRWLGLLLTTTAESAEITEDHSAATLDLLDIQALTDQPCSWADPISNSKRTRKTRGNGLHRGIKDEPHLSLAPPMCVGHSAGGHRFRV